jgi:hypothetical protein
VAVQQVQRYQARMKRKKQGLVEKLKGRMCKLRNHMTSEVEQLRRRYNQKNHMTLKEGVKKKHNHRKFRNRKRWKLFQHQKKRYRKYNI